ncbi:MAG: S9 family peptidase [Planctomycetota bacterium]
MKKIVVLCAALSAGFWPSVGVRAELPPLIPRAVLFGNPDKANPQVSPDGTRLAYIAPDEGVLNVWVRTLGKNDDRVVTQDRKRGIRFFFWAYNNAQILYTQDKGGDENWHVYAVDLKTNEERDLTPLEGVRAEVLAVDPKFPSEILVGINNRNPELHDVYRVKLADGTRTLEAENTEGFTGWVPDHDFKVRAAVKSDAQGGSLLMARDNPDSAWRTVVSWGIEDSLTSDPLGFTPDGRGLYVLSSKGNNTGQLRELDLATGKEKVLASDDQADVADVFAHPVKHTIQAVSFNTERVHWKVLDPAIEADFAAIAKIRDGDFEVINRDQGDQTWLVSFSTDDGPIYYYAFDRKTKNGTLLFSNRKALEDLALAKMEPVSFKARDGLTLHGYLTTPPGIEPKNLPMVLLVHGGPWARDEWGFSPYVQWAANRGYAVLQVNFRGSTGYGKEFVNAANREWGGKMQNDLVDAVQWAVARGTADPKRVAIFGGSYGGYATLVGMTFTPDLFRCGVDIVGPSNLITFMNTIPPYWKPWESTWWVRIGHPEKDAEFLKSRSPLFKIDQIKNPLLIAQGANDPRVKASESRQMVEALKKAGRTVEYVEYPDEGHGFARPENRMDFFAKAEKFLADHLGGRYEP